MRPHCILSVIVPVAPGETQWRALLDDLAGLPATSEILLVRADRDELEMALPASWPQDLPIQQLQSSPGRARQMNLGARHARGRWLWFLHADTRLGPHALAALDQFLARDEEALGWFDLKFRDDGPALTWLNARGARWRSRWLGLPFGDQGFVIPAPAFAQLGSYDETTRYGEDHLLVWAAHAAGLSVRPIGAAIFTSARKYATHGWLRTTLRHGLLTVRQALPAWWRARRRVRR
jgi:rSAM/selenodomain-associated transferase 2